MYNLLKLKAAKHIGIDPDRLSITGSERFAFVVKVQGPIPRAAEQKLRAYLNNNTPAYIQWTVRAVVSD